MKSTSLALLAGLVLAVPRIAGAQDVPAEQFVIVPLRVHILTSPDIDLANCTMTEAQAARMVGEINAIWHKGWHPLRRRVDPPRAGRAGGALPPDGEPGRR